MIELNKIDEIANRLRQYEKDDKPRYFNLFYVNSDFPEPQQIAERVSGETEFRNRVIEAINIYKAEKVIVEEFNQKAKSVKTPASVIEIMIREKGASYLAVPVQSQKQEQPNKEASQQNSFEAYGGLEGFKQEMRGQVAQEFQLIREQEEKNKLVGEVERLTKENKELTEDNTTLFENNQELSEKVQELQKYIPENLKIGDVSVTKMLGSILGTATETIFKNIVLNKPEKLKAILGSTAFDQLSGLLDDQDDDDLETTQEQGFIQELQPVTENSGQDDKHSVVANAIHSLNNRMSSAELGKVQMIYYYFLNEDETINEEKLDEIIQFINKQKQPEDEQVHA